MLRYTTLQLKIVELSNTFEIKYFHHSILISLVLPTDVLDV